MRNAARSNIKLLYALKQKLMVLKHAIDPRAFQRFDREKSIGRAARDPRQRTFEIIAAHGDGELVRWIIAQQITKRDLAAGAVRSGGNRPVPSVRGWARHVIELAERRTGFHHQKRVIRVQRAADGVVMTLAGF